MTRLVIKPQMPGGGLRFDLRDVLQALGPRASTSAWTIDDFTYVSRDEREIPAFHGSEHARISGHQLLASLPNSIQVIDGEFRAYEEDLLPFALSSGDERFYDDALSAAVATLDGPKTARN